VLFETPIQVPIVGQELTPIHIAVSVAGQHDAGSSPEIDVITAVGETRIPAVFQPDSVERLTSQRRDCRKVHLGEIPQPRWRGLPPGTLKNKYPNV
jgi:hypothetical protein